MARSQGFLVLFQDGSRALLENGRRVVALPEESRAEAPDLPCWGCSDYFQDSQAAQWCRDPSPIAGIASYQVKSEAPHPATVEDAVARNIREGGAIAQAIAASFDLSPRGRPC